MVVVLFEIFARFFFEDKGRTGEGGRAVPRERRTRGTRRGHGERVEVPVEQIPVATVVVVIVAGVFQVVQTQGIPLVRYLSA